jgi:glycosyltransferase involved in cell wall biosynthesis
MRDSVHSPVWADLRAGGNRNMKIHAMCLVKNEADVLQETLTSAVSWSDYIYVFDNGSDDGTWELVQELAKQHSQIVPYKQDDVLYTNGLLADIFNAYRSNAGPRDWWCRLDGDEFYIDDPRIFLAKIPPQFQTVMAAIFCYYFTDKDAILYRQDPVSYLKLPVERRLRYYQNDWAVPRFFRHSDDIVWTRDGGFPEGPAYPVWIWMKHYQYRSPDQIERRLRTRRRAIEADTGFRHEALANWSAAVVAAPNISPDFESAQPEFAGTRWEERIFPADSLNYDQLDRRYVVNEGRMSQFSIPPPYSGLRAVIPTPIRAPLGRLRRQALSLLGRPQPIRRS